jgi:hypothetical protein
MRDELTIELENDLEVEGGALKPDLESVLSRGKQMRARRRVGVVLSLVAIVALVSTAIALVPTKRASESSITDTNPAPEVTDQNGGLVEDMTQQEQAEVFAFRALAATELMNPFGKRSYNFTYEPDTTETSAGWRIGFAASDCEPRQDSEGSYSFTCRGLSGEDPQSGNALTDTFVTVTLSNKRWTVTDVEGNMLEEEKERVIGYSLPQRVEPSHWEFPATGVSPTGEEDQLSVETMALWVGPYPTEAPGSVCQVSVVDSEGKVVDRARPMYREPPNRPFERAGWISGSGFEMDPRIDRAVVGCQQYTGPGWEVSSDPEVIRGEDGVVVGVTADLTWRGEEGFTTSANCRASLVDVNGAVVWEGTGNVMALWRPGELKDYPYRTEALITTSGEGVEAESVGEFTCRSL